MSKSAAILMLGLALALPAAGAEPAAGAAAADMQKQLDQFRSDLQAVETEVISKNVSLTTEEATKFWPVFQRFQKEQQTIIDGQAAAVKRYADNYAKLTDEESRAYVKALLERDQRIHDLRVKYLAEYSKVLPPGKAARVIQVSRRLGLVGQMKLSSEVPLVR